MSLSVSFHKFALFYLPVLAAVAAAPPEPEFGQIFFVYIAGIPVPVVTSLLGLIGIALSRPLARRNEVELGWPLFALVTAILVILVELWVVETRPGWLFAFVVSIGVGFAGYSLIEVFGEEVKGLMTAFFGPLSMAKKLVKEAVKLIKALYRRWSRKKPEGDAGKEPE